MIEKIQNMNPTKIVPLLKYPLELRAKVTFSDFPYEARNILCKAQESLLH